METFIENLFGLFSKAPILSISLIFALLLFVIWLFRNVIKSYLIKKFDLYTEDEVKEAFNNLTKNNLDIQNTEIIEEIKQIRNIKENE